MSDDTEWYWDLRAQVAVPASERGPATTSSGRTRHGTEAENWKEKVEERNEGWDDADDDVEPRGESDDGSGQ